MLASPPAFTSILAITTSIIFVDTQSSHQYSWTSLVAQLVKNSPCNEGDLGLISELGRSLGEGNSYPLQYSGLENSVDYIGHGVPKSRTSLSDFNSLKSLPLD